RESAANSSLEQANVGGQMPGGSPGLYQETWDQPHAPTHECASSARTGSAPTSMRSIRRVRTARWRVPGNSGQLLPIAAAPATSRVLILRQYAYRDAELVVIPQPDGSVACIPAWMTHESAARHQLGEFGPMIARRLRRYRPRPSDRWHLDEMVIRIA